MFENITSRAIEFPPIGDSEDCISFAAYDIINRLLDPDPSTRLGTNGAEEVKAHEFFNGIDWEKVRNTKPPIIPMMQENTIEED